MIMNKHKLQKKNKLSALFLAILMSMGAHAQTSDSRPWTFWYWMYGAVSKAGIHADLVAMKNAGLGGCYLMPIKSASMRPEYGGKAEQLSPEFWQMVAYSLQQADSLGLQMGVHVGDGFALAGGPWITPEKSMQHVVWTDTIVGSLSSLALRQPKATDGYYEDIACYAIPIQKGIESLYATPDEVGGTIKRNEKGVFFSKQAGYIDFTFRRPITLRGIEVVPQNANIQCQRMVLETSSDGEHWSLVKRFTPPRQGWQSNGSNVTFTIPPTRGCHFRLSWDPEGSEPGSEELDQAKWTATLKMLDVRFLQYPLIDDYQGKSGAEWRISSATTSSEIGDGDCVKLKDIVELKESNGLFTPTTKLSKKQKAQRWLVLRMGHTSTGMMNATAGGAKGLECDKFSTETANLQFDNWYNKFIQLPHSEVIRYFHIDSWECGIQNWGGDFAEEFEKLRGYDLMPWLPVMAGIPIESAEKSEQVLHDVRLTINNLVNSRFFGQMEKRAHALGRKISHESIAPTFVADGLEHFKYCDNPMGEYWLNTPTHDKPNDMLDAISGAHIYGKNIVQAEGFTEVRGVWDETPQSLKPLLDREFCWGMNKLIFHVNAHNPWMDRRPGMTLDGIGLFFQRDNTWYPLVDGLTGYVERCQRWLQKGEPVADIAVFTGEEMPRRALTPDKLVDFLPSVFGPERVASEHKRLANVGNPMTESPVNVRHNANIFSLDNWNNPLHGYQYDSVNPDVLLNGSAENGKLIGKYPILVVPQGHNISSATSRKIDYLRKNGVKVVDSIYTSSDFSSLGVNRDAILPEGLAYTHRHVAGWGEAYFVSNQTGREGNFSVRFRDDKGYATLYDPLDDSYTIATRTDDGAINLHLDVSGSAFVLFTREKISQAKEGIEEFSHSQTIDGKWTVEYKNTGVRRTNVNLPDDWTSSEDPKVKYYSGEAIYTTDFQYKGKTGSAAILHLPLENGCPARVFLNGNDCGVVWTSPFTVSLSGKVRKGKNTLKIFIANTWRNALLGADNGMPPFDGIWTNGKFRRKDNNLDPAGLTGSVILKF